MPFIGTQPEVGGYSVLDSLTASATASYTLQLNSANFSPASANQLLVSLNGVIQKPGSSFTVSGSTLTFSSALTSSDSIDFIISMGEPLLIGTPSDATVTGSKLASNIGISTTGNIATTGSGTLSVAGTAAITGNTTVGGTLVNTGLITASGGVAIGGTGAANTLDDYEEGTWVPVVKATAGGTTYTYSSDYEFRLPGLTSSTNALPYTKIGNRVFITFSIWFNTAANTRFNIDLPFAYDGSPYGLTGNAIPYSIAANQGLGILGTTDNAQNFDTYTVTSSGGHGSVNYPTNGEVYYFICYQTA